MRYDAIVIGAGPAGATAALALARAGWSVAIVEKAAFPRSKVCGEFMSATNAPLFEKLGLTQEIERLSGPEIRRVGLFAGQDSLSAPMPRPSGSAPDWGRALGRDVLDGLLLHRAMEAGAVAWQPWTAVALRNESGMRVCTLAHGGATQELYASVIIAAHGSWEKGRLPTQIARPHHPSDLLGFKAHFRGGRLAADLMPLLAFPGGYGGMVNSDGGRLSLTCCIRRDALEAERSKSRQRRASEVVFEHVVLSCRGVEDALASATLAGPWLSAGPLDPGIRQLYGGGGLFRVGNAAGEAHPVVAEGISMAMQSGWLLASLLTATGNDARSGRCLDQIGQHYTTNWSARFTPRIRAAALFAHLAMRPVSTTLLLPVLRRLPALLTSGASLSGKTQPSLSTD